jgi:hypothetical protein
VVISEILSLLAVEGSHIQLWIGRKTEALQLLHVHSRRDDYVTVISERDIASIEEMIDMRSEKQTVVSIQAFLIVCASSPWLDVARSQKALIGDTGYATPRFDCLEVLSKSSLAAASVDYRSPLGFFDLRVVPDDVLNSIVNRLNRFLVTPASLRTLCSITPH